MYVPTVAIESLNVWFFIYHHVVVFKLIYQIFIAKIFYGGYTLWNTLFWFCILKKKYAKNSEVSTHYNTNENTKTYERQAKNIWKHKDKPIRNKNEITWILVVYRHKQKENRKGKPRINLVIRSIKAKNILNGLWASAIKPYLVLETTNGRKDGRRRQRRQQLERGRKAAQERLEAAVAADQPLIQRQRP